MINEVKGAQTAVIQNIGNKSAAEANDKPFHHAENKEAHASARPGPEVSLTDTAAKLQALQAQIANQPVVDSQKVESVKKAIADGSFKVDSNRAAEKMAEFESLLSTRSTDK